jgi:hypothetical protein
MAKDLPYYKFEPAQWLTGDIVYESFEVQGLFINICALYWQRDGELTIEDIEKRYKKPAALESLTDYLKIKKGKICIKFLDEQLVERGHVSTVNSANGKKGGRPKSAQTLIKKPKKPNANRTLTEPEANESNKEKRREEKNKKREEEIIFPFDSEEFKNWWAMWIRYKKEEHQDEYKSNLTQQAALKKLSGLAAGDENIAIKIIEQSIAEGWKGLFELKISKNGTKNSSNRQGKFADYFKAKSGQGGNAA